MTVAVHYTSLYSLPSFLFISSAENKWLQLDSDKNFNTYGYDFISDIPALKIVTITFKIS